jgi:hypothetical protein
MKETQWSGQLELTDKASDPHIQLRAINVHTAHLVLKVQFRRRNLKNRRIFCVELLNKSNNTVYCIQTTEIKPLEMHRAD